MAEEEEEARRIVSGGRLRKRRKDGWSRRDERVFLKHFRATCNVNASARAAGKSPSSAQDLPKRDPVFAADWDEALRDSHVRLHGKLIVYAETIDSALPVRPSRARYGKGRRAQPVSALFAQGKAMFAGAFPSSRTSSAG